MSKLPAEVTMLWASVYGGGAGEVWVEGRGERVWESEGTEGETESRLSECTGGIKLNRSCVFRETVESNREREGDREWVMERV